MNKKVNTGTTIAEIATTNPETWPEKIEIPTEKPASVIKTLLGVTGTGNNDLARHLNITPQALSYCKGSNRLSIATIQKLAALYGYRVALIKIK